MRLAARRSDATSEAKLDLQTWVAHHLGWRDLLSDTSKYEKKFNVRMFYDPTKGPRKVRTRPVVLVYPLSQSRHAARMVL
jgi:hypothetical protein